MVWIAVAVVVVAVGAVAWGIAARAGGRHLPREQWEATWREDARELRRLSEQLDLARAELTAIAAASSADPRDVPAPVVRARAAGAWCRFVDSAVAIQIRTTFHRDFLLLLGEGRRRDRLRGFLFCDAADLTVQDAALALTNEVAGNPKWQRILNEARPEFSLDAGSYDRIYDEVHNPERFARQYGGLALLQVYRAFPEFDEIAADEEAAWLLATSNRLHDEVRNRYRDDGVTMTARTAKDTTSGMAFRAWFPVQMATANTMGNVKFLRHGEYLIQPEQIRALRTRLQPGDIGMTRKNWYLSNCGIPGFWPHAIMHIGTPEELETFFDDAEVKAWCAKRDPKATSLPDLLRRRYPAAWASYARTETRAEAEANGAHMGDVAEDAVLRPTFIEAIAPGVVFRHAEETVASDFAAFLRPRLPKVEIACAVEKAFSHAGKPYDYNFDFTTDNELVCSELVYKAYEPDHDRRGLAIPLEETFGRPLLSPTTLARLFDEQHGRDDRLFDFVAFLEGRELSRKAVEAAEEDFRGSWKRPKWQAVAKK